MSIKPELTITINVPTLPHGHAYADNVLMLIRDIKATAEFRSSTLVASINIVADDATLGRLFPIGPERNK